MSLFKKNTFGQVLYLKKWLIRLLGFVSHGRYRRFNKLHIEGSEMIRDLPERGVLFIANHQTYFADVAAMFHVFNAALKGRVDNIKNIGYIWNPKLNIYYVAASETMKKGLLPKIFAYAGAVTVERTWRSNGKDVKRQVKFSDISNIGKAIKDGWLITFPQGTTKPFNPIRKGTAHIIKTYKPIVIPIVIDGFRRSFDKKGLLIKKRNVLQSFVIKKPLEIDYENDSIEKIVHQIEFAIEQHPSFLKVEEEKVISEKEYAQLKDTLNKKRKFWS